MKTQCSKIWAEMVNDETDRHYALALPCGSWKCPICRKINASRLRRLIREALAGWCKLVGYDPAKFRFWAKFLTLTLPGVEWRAQRTPAQAEVEIKDAWRRLRKYLWKNYGDYEFVQVDELQLPSGYPHLHVMLLGASIASKGVLKDIRSFWSGKLGMGNVDIRVIDDLEKAAWYLTKYVTKEAGGVEAKGNRKFSFSKRLRDLAKTQKQERLLKLTPLRVGLMNGDGTFGKVVWERASGLSLEDALEKENFKALIDFFEGKKNGKGDQVFLYDPTGGFL